MILYPAIDLKDGRAVRLVQGDFAQQHVFNEDPVAQARAFAEQGATHLHVVDLDGAKSGEPVHAPLVASIVAARVRQSLYQSCGIDSSQYQPMAPGCSGQPTCMPS